MDQRSHWENIYRQKTPDQLSWTQETPAISLSFIETFPGYLHHARIALTPGAYMVIGTFSDVQNFLFCSFKRA